MTLRKEMIATNCQSLNSEEYITGKIVGYNQACDDIKENRL